MGLYDLVKRETKDFISEFDPRTDINDRVFTYLLVISFILRFLWLDQPGSLIFDETFYVNSVRVILRLPQNPLTFPDAKPGIDPISGHPPLAKGIIALSMMVLGNNPYGFRVPSVIFGTISIMIFYLLAKKLSGNSTLALIASFMFSFDNLVFVQSRIAILDIFMLTFMILGFYWCIKGKMVLGAVAIGLSTLSKYPGLFAVGAVIIYYLLKKNGGKSEYDLKSRLAGLERFIATYVVVLLALLALLGRLYGAYTNPLAQMGEFFSSAAKLTTSTPQGIASYPWQWLINEVQIPYLTVNGNIVANGKLLGTITMMAFVGAMNPAILYLTIQSMVYMAYRYIRSRDNFSLFTMLWFIFTYLPYYPMYYLFHRIEYIFYFLSTIPAVCLAISCGLVDLKKVIKNVKLYRLLIVLYLLLVLVGFYLFFPFKTIP